MLQLHHTDGLEYPPGILLYSARPSSSSAGRDAPECSRAAVFAMPGYNPPNACIRRSEEVADDIRGRRGGLVASAVSSVDVLSRAGIVSPTVDMSSDAMLVGRGYVAIVLNMNKIGISTMVYGSSLLNER